MKQIHFIPTKAPPHKQRSPKFASSNLENFLIPLLFSFSVISPHFVQTCKTLLKSILPFLTISKLSKFELGVAGGLGKGDFLKLVEESKVLMVVLMESKDFGRVKVKSASFRSNSVRQLRF